MKHKLFSLLFAACGLLSCTDGIWDAIHGLEDDYTNLELRVAKLEELCSEMNTNISALQTLVSVILTNDYIISITPITKESKEIGYVITFAIHEPITIYHGQNGQDGQDGVDGTTPIIGVARDPDDNAYYWTLNGEWLLDKDGNRIPLTSRDGQNGADGQNGQDGADGKDGITPQLKIEDGYWYVSTDNGKTWTQLGKAVGEDGQDGQDGQAGQDGKDGQDGDSMFSSVTQDDEFVYFTLADGTVIMVPIGKKEDIEYEYVDLGLSVKWATMNVGAKLPGDIGTLCTCPNPIAGGEDMATKERGGTWRTPTVSEVTELIDQCFFYIDHVINSSGEIVYGFKIRGKNGDNQNSIFLPFQTYSLYSSTEILSATQDYWTSNINMTDEQITGRILRIRARIYQDYYNSRISEDYYKSIYDGFVNGLFPIRPVCE